MLLSVKTDSTAPHVHKPALQVQLGKAVAPDAQIEQYGHYAIGLRSMTAWMLCLYFMQYILSASLPIHRCSECQKTRT